MGTIWIAEWQQMEQIHTVTWVVRRTTSMKPTNIDAKITTKCHHSRMLLENVSQFCMFVNYRLDQILAEINRIWNVLHPPENNQIVTYASCEAAELVKILAGKPYDLIDFNSTEYNDICIEGSSYALQYYAGGIFVSIISKLRIILTWQRGYYAGVMFSMLLLKFIVNSERSREKLLDNSYISSDTIVRIYGEIYEVACCMRDELGDDFDDFEHFNQIATIIGILPPS